MFTISRARIEFKSRSFQNSKNPPGEGSESEVSNAGNINSGEKGGEESWYGFVWKLPAKIRVSYGSKRIRISRLSGVPCARRSKGSALARVCVRLCACARAYAYVNAAGPVCALIMMTDRLVH